MAAKQQLLYIKVGDDFIPFDESTFAVVNITLPGEQTYTSGMLQVESARELVGNLINPAQKKKPGRAKATK